MTYTTHATERLLQRYGLEPSETLTELLERDYTVDNIDIIGIETREVTLKYVTKKGSLITFLPTQHSDDSFFTVMVNLRKDLDEAVHKIKGYKKSISNKDKQLHQVSEEFEELVDRNNQLTIMTKEHTDQISLLEKQLKESRHYARALKKKLDKKGIMEREVIIHYDKEKQIQPLLSTKSPFRYTVYCYVHYIFLAYFLQNVLIQF